MTDTKLDLPRILAEHRLWVRDEGGSRADLSETNLSEANLRGADLSGSDLSGVASVCYLGQPDGFRAYAYVHADGIMRVQIGCQNKTLAEGREYWAGKDDRREVLAALNYAEEIARLRGWDVATKECAA